MARNYLSRVLYLFLLAEVATADKCSSETPKDMGLVMLQVGTSGEGHHAHKNRHNDKNEFGHKVHSHEKFRSWGSAVPEDELVSLIEENSARADAVTSVADIGVCFSSRYGVALGLLIALVAGLAVALGLQVSQGRKLRQTLLSMRAKLKVDKQRLLADDKTIRAQEFKLKEDQRMLMQAVHERGNVYYDPVLREFVLKKEVPFHQLVRAKSDTSLPAPAKFANVKAAHLILRDVAELLAIVVDAVVLIEGHTQGGMAEAVDEIAHEIADSRADLVKCTLTGMGVKEYRLLCLGLPGSLGNNKSDVLLKIID